MLPSWVNEGVYKVDCDLAVVWWGKWLKKLFLFVTAYCWVFENFSKSCWFSENASKVSQIMSDCLKSITFRSCGKKRSCVSSGGCISESWRFMSCVMMELPSMVCAASEKQKRGIIMSLFKIMVNKCLLRFNLIKYQIKT